jgi:fibro-slime domain-containing protein
LTLLVAAALGWALLRAARSILPAGDGLTAQYFTNAAWGGLPSPSVVDPAPSTKSIRQHWKGAPPEHFSVQWTGFLSVPESASYLFATTSDDGSWLYIDERLVVDNGGAHVSSTQSARVSLTKGPHRIRLDYTQLGGTWAFEWSWARNDGRATAVPVWALSQHRPRERFVNAVRAVETGLAGLAILTAIAAAANAWLTRTEWLRVIANGVAACRTTVALRPRLVSTVFEVLILIVTLVVPWPGAGGQPTFFRSIGITVDDLAKSGEKVLMGGFAAFQANINTPRAGEDRVLPVSVLEMLAMVRDHHLDRYEISSGVAADVWSAEQIVASAWPSKREAEASWQFEMNSEPLRAGCTLTERRTEVYLVHCH